MSGRRVGASSELPKHQSDECARGTKGCDIEHEPDDEGPCFGTEPEPWDHRTVAAVVELLRARAKRWPKATVPRAVLDAAADFIESHPRFKDEGWADGGQ